MKKHLNTLYVTLEDAYLHQEGKTVEILHKGERKLRVPLHNLEGIVAFGWNITASAALMHACAENGTSLSFLSPTGRFLASSYGGVSGNVLLRKDQYAASEDPRRTNAISRNIIAAKIHNSRHVLERAIRDYPEDPNGEQLRKNADFLKHRIRMAMDCEDLDQMRGIEGDAAAIYFSAFDGLLTQNKPSFSFEGREKRPPTDPVNALLSFLYVMLMHDCKSACEAVGLDPQCGFLHRDRPGRFSLALDLSEEFRAYTVDRLVINLINRQQIDEEDFEKQESGAVLIKDDSRKKILAAWQEKKQEEITHPFIGERITRGLLPHIQARLLSRHLRGDLDAYPAFVWK